MEVKVWNYLEEYKEEKDEIINAIERVFESGTLIFGDNLKNFEDEFAKYCNSQYGIGVGNCTDAIRIALEALGIGKGDEVITVSNTAIPTVSAIVQSGATPVFVDINEKDYLLDVNKIEDVITNKTKCILPVHLFGQCADMDVISQIAKIHDCFILEDCAQAHGSLYKGNKAGSFGNVSAFSFYPTKVLGTYGDGGMIVTNNETIYELSTSLRFYGIEGYGKPEVTRKYYSERHGYNSRLDELHASILLGKLGHIEEYISNRRKIAEIYNSELSNLGLVLPNENNYGRHVYYIYCVRHPDRDRILNELRNHDIYLNISYPYPIHLMNGYKQLGYKKGDLPITEKFGEELFSLPMYPSLNELEIEYIINTLKKILSNKS